MPWCLDGHAFIHGVFLFHGGDPVHHCFPVGLCGGGLHHLCTGCLLAHIPETPGETGCGGVGHLPAGGGHHFAGQRWRRHQQRRPPDRGQLPVLCGTCHVRLRVCQAAQSLIAEHAADRATAGIIGLAAAFLTTPFPTGVQFADFGGAIYLAVGSTIIPYLLSLVGQRYVRPPPSAVILSFESVFGCLASVLVLGDRLTPRFVLGAAVVLFSFFVAEGIVPGMKR